MKNTSVCLFLETGFSGRIGPALSLGKTSQELLTVDYDSPAHDINPAGEKRIRKISGRRADNRYKGIRGTVRKNIIQGIVQQSSPRAQYLIARSQLRYV
jgi:hypothetical protein